MSRAYAIQVPRQQVPAAVYCGANRKSLRRRKSFDLNARIAVAARELYGAKAEKHVAVLTGYSVRACEYWFSPTKPTTIPGDALEALIRSEHGRRFLAAIMDTARPAWWRGIVSFFTLSDALAFQRTAERQLKAAIDAHDDISAAIARSEAALAVRRAKRDRAAADGRRAGAGILDRAMAAASVQGGRR